MSALSRSTATITVTVEKTVQERQYEPIKVAMTATMSLAMDEDTPSDFVTQANRALYSELSSNVREALDDWLAKKQLSDIDKIRKERRERMRPGSEEDDTHPQDRG